MPEEIKQTGKMCGRQRNTCDTACALCVYHPAESKYDAQAGRLHSEGIVPAPERFVIYCGCQPVEIRVNKCKA